MKSKVMNQTTTISISRWMGRTFPLLALAAMGLFASCRNEATSEPVQTKTAQEAATSYREGNIDFPLAADFNITFNEETESTLRGISATVSPTLNAKGRHGITLPNKLSVLCIIRSSDAGEEPTYYEAEAVKGPNGYHIEKERIKLRSGSTLAPGKKWYIMIAMGGTYDKNAGQMKFGASGPEAAPVATSTGRVMDIPAVSHWMEMPTYPNGHPKWPKDWSQEEKLRKLEVFPQGVLCRATLRLDDAYKQRLGSGQVALTVNRLRIVSTSLSFAGYFSLAKNDLPAIDFKSKTEAVRGGANNGNLMKWVPTQTAAAKKEFTALNASTPEYEKIFTGDVFSLQGGSSAKIFSDTSVGADVKRNVEAGIPTILFWAIPTNTSDAEHRSTTLIAETGTSSNARILEPKHTYIYGKKHRHQVLSGKSVYFDAVYYHPYTPLDYMAEYNVVRKEPWQFVNGGTIPHGTSNQLDTQHGVNSFAMLTRGEASQVNLTRDGRLYKSPSIAQWESIIPFQGAAAVNTQGGNVDRASVAVSVGSLSGDTEYSSRQVGNVVYALALKNLGGTQKHCVAYRYQHVNNPQAPKAGTPFLLLKQDFDASTANTAGPYHKANPRFSVDGVDVYDPDAFQVEAIHLGSHFIGEVDDIANEAFWTNAAMRKEQRMLPMHYTSFRAYLAPTHISDADKRKLGNRKVQAIYRYYQQHGGWGASFNVGKISGSYYWVGDRKKVAMSVKGAQWFSGDGRHSEDQYDVIRYSCRPFTTQEHP
jgi:hypothetical protein